MDWIIRGMEAVCALCLDCIITDMKREHAGNGFWAEWDVLIR